MSDDTPGLPSAAIEGPIFNKFLMGMTVVGLGFTAANMFLPAGKLLPTPILIVQVTAFSVMLMMHLARCLGLKAMLLYLLWMMGLEFLSEQVDIVTNGGWYGAHFVYTDAWGPRFMPGAFQVLSTSLERRIVTHDERLD